MEREILEAPTVALGGQLWQRILVRTHLITPADDIKPLAQEYLGDVVREGDIVFVGEKVLSITQGRLVKGWTIEPRPLARFLAGMVRKSPYGFGLRRPQVMEMAFREAGTLRILLASVVGGLGRLLGRSGDFYRVAGRRVAAIDGPNQFTIPPYNRYVVLSPKDPSGVARELSKLLGTGVAIVDTNFVGSVVLGQSPGVDSKLVATLLRDNPMGQGWKRTPLGLLRPLGADPATAAGAEP